MIRQANKEEKLLKTLTEHGLLAPSRCVLAAVSGGSDSTALLGLLDGLAKKLEWQLEVVHFDHGLRAESAVDAQWVCDLSARLKRVCHLRRTKQLVKLSSGIPAAARRWREEEMEKLVFQQQAAWIASAHHQDDQLETLFMQWLRGVHPAHWRGIAPQRGSWIRPLLEWSRSELRQYLHQRGWDWREDSSNLNLAYRRNRLRSLMPSLKEISGHGLEARLLAAREQALNWQAWLSTLPPLNASSPEEKENHWLEIASLQQWPLPTQTEGLRQFIQKRKPGRLEACHLQAALQLLQKGNPHWQLNLPHCRQLSRIGPKLWLKTSAPLLR